MRTFLQPLSGDKKAAEALEFAIMMPIVLVFMLGIIEFGRLIWTIEALQQSAAAASRCMGVLAASCATAGKISTASTTHYIQGIAGTWGITVPPAQITLNSNASYANTTGFSTVTITYQFSTLVPYLFTALGAVSTLNAGASFPNQPQ